MIIRFLVYNKNYCELWLSNSTVSDYSICRKAMCSQIYITFYFQESSSVTLMLSEDFEKWGIRVNSSLAFIEIPHRSYLIARLSDRVRSREFSLHCYVSGMWFFPLRVNRELLLSVQTRIVENSSTRDARSSRYSREKPTAHWHLLLSTVRTRYPSNSQSSFPPATSFSTTRLRWRLHRCPGENELEQLRNRFSLVL